MSLALRKASAALRRLRVAPLRDVGPRDSLTLLPQHGAYALERHFFSVGNVVKKPLGHMVCSISTSNVTVIKRDGVLQEKRETTNQQVKKFQSGDTSYQEARHSQQVKDRIEGEGFSAERMAAQRQDQKVLTCGDVTKERTMNSRAMASRVGNGEGTLENVAMAREETQKQFNKGILEQQHGNKAIAASRTLVNANGVSRIAITRKHSTDGPMSPVVTSPVCGQAAQFCLPSSNQYLPITQELNDHFKQLVQQAPSKVDMKTIIRKFSEHIQSFVDKLKKCESVDDSIEILQAMVVSVKNAWAVPTYGHDLGFAMCNVLRESGGLDKLIQFCTSTDPRLSFEAATLLEQALSTENRAYVVEHGLEGVVAFALHCSQSNTPSVEKTRIGTGILCHMFKHSEATCSYLIKKKALDAIVYNCRSADVETLRHCATALANLSLYGGLDNHQAMISSKRPVPMWLFPLAFHSDDNIRYWACLAVSALCANKEIEADVLKSGTLDLVEPFCTSRNPEEFARSSIAHVHGQSKDWLERFVPVLNSKRKEAVSLAAFHFAMEAGIKKRQGNSQLFAEIGAVTALKSVASSPNAIASKFAAQALQLIGEKLPHKLSQQVPLWTENDVILWVEQIGFKDRAHEFLRTKVDGDLLLQIDELMLEKDIGIQKQLLRKRFMRELKKLKQMADYSSVDPTNLCQVLQNIDAEFTQYTYSFLRSGVDTASLSTITDDQLQKECEIDNSVHRKKILSYLSVLYPSFNEVDPSSDSKKNIDVFISYRRATGSQLASLLKVHLQLKGFTVFLDVERLEAGKFDNNLLSSIKQAKSFLLVLTPNALDRCKNDLDCKDWVHKEIVQAIQAGCNIIPIMDNFYWPEELPEDIQAVMYYNGVKWIHDYQDACVDKIERFIRGDRQTSEKAGTATPGSPPTARGWKSTRGGSVDSEKPPSGQPTVEMPQSPPPANDD